MSKLVAVYGSLRKGFHNNGLLSSSKLLGEQLIEGYGLYSLGTFPAAVEEEGQLLTVEVWELPDAATLGRLDRLEGTVNPDGDDPRNMYNRTTISTDWGDAYLYVYNSEVNPSTKVVSGDWSTRRERV